MYLTVCVILIFQAWNSNVSLITSEQLLRLGAIAIGFSHADLGNMALLSNDVIENLGSQPIASNATGNATSVVGYTMEQVS